MEHPPRLTSVWTGIRPEIRTAASFGAIGCCAIRQKRVFEAFAKPELLARWWGPDGFTNILRGVRV
jgi:hypothetical protein